MISLLAAPAAGAETFVAVDSSNRLYRFDDARPDRWKRTALTGLGAGERIVGLDVRPANRQLIALTNLRRLYAISRSKRTATLIGSEASVPAFTGSKFGLDFNPVVDRIRAVNSGGQNMRLNPDTGAAMTDGMLFFKDGGQPMGSAATVVGAAYTNNFKGAMSTTLYGIDSGRDTLVIQDPPNAGALTTVGGLGADLTGSLSFDISARDGRAYVLARRAGAPRSRLYRMNLGTGAVRQVGIVRRAPTLVAFAALSAPRAP